MADPAGSSGSGKLTGSAKPDHTISGNIPYITDLLEQLTTDAASLPGRSDLQFHRTLDRSFAKQLDASSKDVLDLTGQLVKLLKADHISGWRVAKGQAGKVKGKGKEVEVKDEEDVTDDFRKTIGETIDALLEDADAKLDEASGAQPASQLSIDPRKAAAASKKLPGPFAATAAGAPSRLPANITSARIAKPQLSFPDAVNNDPSFVWKPTLSHKAHAMVDLSHVNPAPTEPPARIPIEQLSDEQRRAQNKTWDRYYRAVRQRLHPYWFETENLPYPTRMFELAPPIEPRPLDEQEAILVDTKEGLEEMVKALKEAKEIAVDLEYHNTRSYYGFTCLMQISTREKDWIVDTLKVRGELRDGKLGGVMADPSIVKVFHGAESDVLWLQQDFDIYIVNLFDTYHATHVLGHQSHSLAGLLSRYANFAADKRYQLADWRIRPLPKAMLQYAQSDTHFLLYIYDHLRNELLAMASRPPSPAPEAAATATNSADGSEAASQSRQHTPETNPQRSLRQVLASSADTVLGMYARDNYDPVTGKGSGGWRTGRKKYLAKNQYGSLEGLVFVRVHQWRDRMARERDESPHWWLPNDYIRNIATSPLSSPAAIASILNRPTRSRETVGAHNCSKEISAIVQAAKAEYATLTVQQKMALELTEGWEKDREALAFLGQDWDPASASAAAAASQGGAGLNGAGTVPAARSTPPTGPVGSAAAPTPISRSSAASASASFPDMASDLWSFAAPGHRGSQPSAVSEPLTNASGPFAQVPTTSKKGSALFGKTIKAKAQPKASANPSPVQTPADGPSSARPTKKASALFGRALPSKAAKTTAQQSQTPTARLDPLAASKAFEEAQRSILSDVGSGLLPFPSHPALPAQISVSAASASAAGQNGTSASSTFTQEAIDTAPKGRVGVDQLKSIAAKGRAAAETSQTAPGAVSAPTGPAQTSAAAQSAAEAIAPKVKAKKDDIVQVKRKKVKHPAPTGSASASPGPSGSGPAIGESSTSAESPAASAGPPKPKAKKTKAKSSLAAQASASDTAAGSGGSGGVEMFDYAAQPDFLSASHQRHLVEGGRDKEKADEEARKSKKAKKKAKADGPPTSVIETPDFGPRPRDMTQSKAGSKSHTFTS